MDDSRDYMGIDLGTTYSCGAIVKEGKVEVVPTPTGKRSTPSVVTYKQNETVVGESAKHNRLMNLENTIYDSKRLLGYNYYDPAIIMYQQTWPFNVVEREYTLMVETKINDSLITYHAPEEVSSHILEFIRKYISSYTGTDAKKAVITVPAYFRFSQRLATYKAAKLAGIEVLRIINEPTAAAIAYAYQEKSNILSKSVSVTKKEEAKIDDDENVISLVYDFGGGTFDVSILCRNKLTNTISVLSSGGDNHLGGQDITDNLVKYYADLLKENDYDIYNPKKAKSLSNLRDHLDEAKVQLSISAYASLDMELLDDNDVDSTLTRSTFDEINAELYNRTMTIVKETIRKANKAFNDIDEIILIGGSSRINKIQEMLTNIFHREVLHCINADEAVSIGACYYAKDIISNKNEIKIHDIVSHSLGIEGESTNDNNLMSVIIPKNSKIPCRNCKTYRNISSDDKIVIKIYEGDNYYTTDNYLVDTFEISDIGKHRQGTLMYSIEFLYNENGLTVTVTYEGKLFVHKVGYD